MKFISIQVYQTDIIWQSAKLSTLSKSVYETKTFYLKFFLYIKKLTGNPITNGVGANNNCNFSGYYLYKQLFEQVFIITCSAQLIHVGNKGITGNIYSKG